MTENATNFATKAFKLAGERTETTRKILRRNRLAYLGLHGMAFDQAKAGAEKLRKDREAFFNSLVAKGEEMEAGASKVFKSTEDIAETGRERVWNLLPGSRVNRVETLEAEVAEAKKKLKSVKTATKKKVKAAPPKAKKVAAKAAKAAEKGAAQPAAKADTVTEKVAPAKAVAPAKSETKATASVKAPVAATARAKPATPRHIPYFNDVKRYDPLASEDIVRKIVNHCGIALSSEDARYVACSDETERNRVRDSWLKKKLDVQGSDADLNKKVQNVCSIMQRDNRKNRVTFYYLAAKAERKLEAI